MSTRTHVLSVLVENHPGVLARISGMFAQRGFNIDSLAVSETHDPTCSRMSIVVTGDSLIVEQITKQLNKLVDVITIQNVTEREGYVERELMLIKVEIPEGKRTDILEIATIFKAKAVDITTDAVTFEIAGRQEKLETFLDMLRPFGLLEVARTGRIGLLRGSEGLHSGFLKTIASQEAALNTAIPS